MTATDRSKAVARHLHSVILRRYGTVTAFAPMLSTIKVDALRDNLNGDTHMRLNVMIEILEALDLSFDEAMNDIGERAA